DPTGNTTLDGENNKQLLYFYQDDDVTVSNLSIVNGYGDFGGGIFMESMSNPMFVNVRFEDNNANYGGGAYLGFNTSPNFSNCTFYDNSVTGFGGGFISSASSPTITNSLFNGNHADVYGGAVAFQNSFEAYLTHCTIDGNTADAGGAGMYIDMMSSVNITGSIIRDDIYTEGYLRSANFSFSNVLGGATGTGNIDIDPLFNDEANRDFTLATGSPCIDAANPSEALESGSDGIASYPAQGTTLADMGAFGGVLATDWTVPETPVNFTISIGNNQANLSWDPVESADCYFIYYSDTPDGIYVKISTPINATVWSDPLSLSTRYYKVKAFRY
ncbi:MAG: right-handed parallel beta-helix repeat-containing protein, partial [Candidatus Cloacimonetes bacterium]|nr:right-handed parallel beta-helix repeat-containing protein [Candidatus Cloacimonadota bacterium]